MAKLLHIVASPRPESFSSRVAEVFLDIYRQAHPKDAIERLDLFTADLPPFLAPQAKAKYVVMGGQQPKDEAGRAWAGVIKVIDHFKGFDRYLISSAMWNFGIPYRLKQYIDVIVQPGLTFKYSAESGYTGLVAGKPMMLILARGGQYGPGNPLETFDFQESYLRSVFGFIGFTDFASIHVEPTLQGAPEQIEQAFKAAQDQARKMPAQWAVPAHV
jgi:FMN-dependent NADH-azoreductase